MLFSAILLFLTHFLPFFSGIPETLAFSRGIYREIPNMNPLEILIALEDIGMSLDSLPEGVQDVLFASSDVVRYETA